MTGSRSERVRVLHFTRFINRYDFIDVIVRHADSERFWMAAATLTARCTSESPRYADVGIPGWNLDADSRSRYPVAVLRLARLLRSQRIDILHTHHYEESVLGALAVMAARRGHLIVGRHYHDELYLIARGIKLKRLLALETFSNRVADLIVVPSPVIQRLLVERQGVPVRKVRVIPYGFDFGHTRYRPADAWQTQALRKELGLDGKLVLGNFGRHVPTKGQDVLLQAFAKVASEFPNLQLLMVGDGPTHSALRTLARQLGVDGQVVFAGWRADAVRLMDAVDVVVHPTFHEAFSQTMVEALAKARPLIFSEVSGAEQLAHMRTAVLVPPRDPGRLAGALHWVVNHPEAARALGERGRADILPRLDIREIVPLYEACYDAVVRAEA